MTRVTSYCRTVLDRDDQSGERPPDRFRARPTEGRFGAAVPIDDLAAGVHHHHGVEGGLEDRLEPRNLIGIGKC